MKVIDAVQIETDDGTTGADERKKRATKGRNGGRSLAFGIRQLESIK